MNRRSNKRTNNQNIQTKKIVIRCTNLSRPVFESDTCGEFTPSVGKESEKKCKNCTHSF